MRTALLSTPKKKTQPPLEAESPDSSQHLFHPPGSPLLVYPCATDSIIPGTDAIPGRCVFRAGLDGFIVHEHFECIVHSRLDTAEVRLVEKGAVPPGQDERSLMISFLDLLGCHMPEHVHGIGGEAGFDPPVRNRVRPEVDPDVVGSR